MFTKLRTDSWQVTNHLTNKRWPSFYSQWKARPDVGSHKQQLTVQRARKAVAGKSVEEENMTSFVSEGQRGEKPEPTEWDLLFPSAQDDSLRGTTVVSTNAVTWRHQAIKSIHVFYLTNTWAKVCAQQAVGLLSLYDVNMQHIKSPHAESFNRDMRDLQRRSWQLCPSQSSLRPSGFAAVPQREPTSSKVFPEGACTSESCGSYRGWQQELPGDTRSLSVVPTSLLSM